MVAVRLERDARRVVVPHLVGQRERREVELARAAAGRLEVVPERARQAVGEVRVSVDRLPRPGRLTQAELAEEFDVGRRLEVVEDPDEVVGVQGRQLALVVGQRLVDGAERLAGRHGLHLALGFHVLPEGDDVSAVPMRAGIEQVGRRHDGCARARRV